MASLPLGILPAGSMHRCWRMGCEGAHRPACGLGDRYLLVQALANLLENTLRHTPKGTDIVVQVTRSRMSSGPVLIVEDGGPGTPPKARVQVLRRFHRLDPKPVRWRQRHWPRP